MLNENALKSCLRQQSNAFRSQICCANSTLYQGKHSRFPVKMQWVILQNRIITSTTIRPAILDFITRSTQRNTPSSSRLAARHILATSPARLRRFRKERNTIAMQMAALSAVPKRIGGNKYGKRNSPCCP